MLNDFENFINDFNIVDNALKMRTLKRWNGRDLRNDENLSEHTHLVIACIFEIYGYLYNKSGVFELLSEIDFYRLIKTALLHDSLELLRGDILSVTKDAIPGLRYNCDKEEEQFLKRIVGEIKPFENDLIKLADLLACNKFVERELKFQSYDFAKEAYNQTYKKFLSYWNEFCKKYGLEDCYKELDIINVPYKFKKGYYDDAGIDIVLEEDVSFMPHSTSAIDLNVVCVPSENTMSILCARTSAAQKGLNVAMCPIDPNFNGTITAIVHNISNDIISYKRGESFCQLLTVKLSNTNIPSSEILIKNCGKRSDGKLGSTGK